MPVTREKHPDFAKFRPPEEGWDIEGSPFSTRESQRNPGTIWARVNSDFYGMVVAPAGEIGYPKCTPHYDQTKRVIDGLVNLLRAQANKDVSRVTWDEKWEHGAASCEPYTLRASSPRPNRPLSDRVVKNTFPILHQIQSRLKKSIISNGTYERIHLNPKMTVSEYGRANLKFPSMHELEQDPKRPEMPYDSDLPRNKLVLGHAYLVDAQEGQHFVSSVGLPHSPLLQAQTLPSDIAFTVNPNPLSRIINSSVMEECRSDELEFRAALKDEYRISRYRRREEEMKFEPCANASERLYRLNLPLRYYHSQQIRESRAIKVNQLYEKRTKYWNRKQTILNKLTTKDTYVGKKRTYTKDELTRELTLFNLPPRLLPLTDKYLELTRKPFGKLLTPIAEEQAQIEPSFV